jgi:hypothetical protein
MDDDMPTLDLKWEKSQKIGRMELTFDTDYDHPMESVLMGHPETVMPFCVKHYRVLDCGQQVVVEQQDNHQTRNILTFDPPLVTNHLALQILDTYGDVPAALFEIRCYEI